MHSPIVIYDLSFKRNPVWLSCRRKSVVFCTGQNITEPHLIVRLPLLEPIILSNGVRAFRVMATLENNTGYNLSGASVRVSFGEEPGEFLDVLISEKLFIGQLQQLINLI